MPSERTHRQFVKSTSYQHNTQTLIKYFKSRGKLVELVTSIAMQEIETTNRHNELFRGNTIFTRVFTEYIKLYCRDYLEAVIEALQDVLPAHEGRSATVHSNPATQDVVNNVLEVLSDVLVENFVALPPHLLVVLRQIYSMARSARGELAAQNVLETLVFLRFVLPPLSHHAALLKQITALLKHASLLSGTSPDDGRTEHETTFITAVSLLYREIVTGPSSFGMSFRGINTAEQEESYHEMVELLRANMHALSAAYGEGYEAVFAILKGKQDARQTAARSSESDSSTCNSSSPRRSAPRCKVCVSL